MKASLRLTVFAAVILAFVSSSPTRAADAAAGANAHTDAALKLLETMGMEKTLNDATGTVLDMQIRQNPQLANLRGVMKTFMEKYMSWDALKNELATAYAAEFTEAELGEMTAFFKTPTGKKFANKQSVLMQKGMEIGQRRVQEHMPELQQAIRAELQKNQPAAPGQP